ncbi:MAG TPA: threonine--tRNA ligase [Thermoplasmata archaeon]|nr:threonine--tRNA ligase [Thermoplasmata archaeon]HEV2428985.1 threonine--tRNA ligase [Thermoplasmata archaeon]
MPPDATVRLDLPDGQSREVTLGTLVGDVLAAWGPSEASRFLAARLDGTLVDLRTPVRAAGRLEPLTFADADGRLILHHSAAHLVAKAVVEAIPGALPTNGPPSEEGFYYDFDMRPIAAEDLPRIEASIARSVKAKEPFERMELPVPDALARVGANRHKTEYVRAADPSSPISFYRTGEFLDLCRGPHVPHSGWLEGTKILGTSTIRVGGPNGEESRERVRGVAFPTRAELDQFLKLRAEAEARDHRSVGTRLGLFLFDESAPGFPFWLPHGMIVIRELERFVTEHFVADGYQEVRTPLLYDQSVYVTSGHWEHYRENMFLSQVEERTYGIKPMNCPGSMLIFRARSRSYRELPLRLAEFAPLHRREPSGTLHGLTRVREFVQDDAHVFVSEEQIEGELRSLLAWIQRAFSVFRLEWSCEISTRPTHFLGDPSDWDRAEATLRSVVEEAKVPHKISEGEGAFYGPKIDIHVRDSLGRPWQTGTIQLDYQIPRRFGLEYQGADGHRHTPIVIHRTILGTWERFLGVFLEHCGGRLPPWLAPVQVRLLPVSERHESTVRSIHSNLVASGIRAELGGSADTLSKRVREAEMDRIPYVGVVGDAEGAAGTVAVRTRGQKGQRAMTVEALRTLVLERIATRSFDP